MRQFILISAFGLDGASAYIIPPLTFILTSLICETYRWQAAYSQATLIGTFIAMRAVGTSAQEDIWLYVQSRLIDNWIGVMIGMAVALLFWPQANRTELAKRLQQFLQQVPNVFATSVNYYLSPHLLSPHTSVSALTPSACLTQLAHLTQLNQKTLATASTEFQSEAIIEENWSAILASQSQIERQLANLVDLSEHQCEERSTLAPQFVNELVQFTTHLTATCDHLSMSLTDVGFADSDSTNSANFTHLQQDVAQMEAKLEKLRVTGESEQWSVIEVVQCFQLLELCHQLVRSLQALQVKLLDRTRGIAHHRRRPILTLPQWKSVSYQRTIEIVGMGMAIGMILAIIHHISFPYPSVYAKVASLVVVGGIIFLVQPTRDKAIAMSIGATLCLYITLFWIYLIATAFGFNPFSSALLYFLIYISCGVLGFTPIARIGVIIAADIFAKDIFPFFEQGLQAVALSILVAVLISLSLLITHLFMGGSAATQFTQSVAQTYRQLGQVYKSLFTRYLQDQSIGENINLYPTQNLNQDNNWNIDAEIIDLKQTIASTLSKYPLMFKVAGIEQGTSVLATRQKRLWSVWLSHEQQLFTQLSNLEEAMQTPLPHWIKQQLLPELQTITQQTIDRFNQIATQITDPREHLPCQASLTPPIEALEQQLLSLRTASRDYPVTTLISFSTTFLLLKTIAHSLEQVPLEQMVLEQTTQPHGLK